MAYPYDKERSSALWAVPPAWGRVIAAAVSVFAGVLILMAGMLGHSQSPTVTDVRTTWGTVLGYEVVPAHGTTGTVYHAVVWYKPPLKAAPVMFTDPDATNVAPAIGSRVRVDYQPKNPSNAHVISELYDWVPWVVMAIGAATILYGCVGLARRGRRAHDGAVEVNPHGRSDQMAGRGDH